MKVLVVEDTPEYQKIIARTLVDYRVKIVGSAEEALTILKTEDFDLMIIDINLPQKNGYSLISEIQSNPDLSDIPLLCLTGRSEITDKITAFSLGVDDYITKPFDPLELRARVEVRLKKNLKNKDKELITTVGDLEIDHSKHMVSITKDGDKSEIDFTKTEFKLLSCLARRPDQVYTRDQLIVAAWGENSDVQARVVDAHICLLRKKLGSYSNCIVAVKGVGYKLSSPHKKLKSA